MFRYNRNINRGTASYGIHNTPTSIRSFAVSKNFAKQQLSNYLNDVTNFRFHTLNKAKQINALTDIRDQRYIANKTAQIGNLNNLRDNKLVDRGQILANKDSLPKPREYKDLKEKETKVVSDPKDIVHILNAVNNNTQLNMSNLEKKQTIIDNNIQTKQTNIVQQKQVINKDETSKKQQQSIQYKHVISVNELINRTPSIVENLQMNYYQNTRYDFYKLIQFIHMMYERLAQNASCIMIIAKGISQANKKQMIKLPEDKIGDIVQYIISQIKLEK